MRLSFHAPCDADREWIKAAAFAGGARSCDYSFANIVGWGEFFGEDVASVNGRLVLHSDRDGGYYTWGVGGDGDLDGLLRLLACDAEARNETLAIWGLDQADRAWLEAHHPDCFDFQTREETWDYCYAIGNLAELPGGKFSKKRNNIRSFEAAFPNWRPEPLTSANSDACLAIAAAWEAENESDGTHDRNSDGGERALRCALGHMADWGLDGLILFVGSRPLAFTVGERLSSEFYDVLHEKAPRGLRGAYSTINREFARYITRRYPDVRYLNREDTMGEPHLKQAKEQYHPDLMVVKQCARLKAGILPAQG